MDEIIWSEASRDFREFKTAFEIDLASVVYKELKQGINNRNYVEIYQKVKKFHVKHRNPKSSDDWTGLVKDLKQFKNSFEGSLALAVIDEIQRVYDS